MSFSFDSCRPEEEGTAGTTQGQGVPGFTDSGKLGEGGKLGWAARTLAEPWRGRFLSTGHGVHQEGSAVGTIKLMSLSLWSPSLASLQWRWARARREDRGVKT